MHVDGKNASNPEQYLNAKSINTMERKIIYIIGGFFCELLGRREQYHDSARSQGSVCHGLL
jgi:hypothetical protein